MQRGFDNPWWVNMLYTARRSLHQSRSLPHRNGRALDTALWYALLQPLFYSSPMLLVPRWLGSGIISCWSSLVCNTAMDVLFSAERVPDLMMKIVSDTELLNLRS